MAVPKKKTSKSRRNQRRAHDGLEKINVVFDKTTGEPKLAHHMTLKSKMYNGRKVITKVEKAAADQEQQEAVA